ncbi:MAG: polysaccharide deacetylase family protein, partial [Clostridia bacterium]|nr:polysaccharide deacetylase family protein [Clostridia bacterium]
MISMDDLLCKRYDEKRPFAVFTFDDGFADNLSVAMPLMKEYGARGTIFVNPDFYSDVADENSPYGFMTRGEWKTAGDSGVFDLQAHTMTHEFIFCSDRLLDVYTKDKFKKYYWLSWMLFPESVHHWNSQAESYRDRIPEGFPIFEYTRRLSASKFTPKQESVQMAIAAYQSGERDLNVLGKIAAEGATVESDAEFLSVVRDQLLSCKRILEESTGKSVHTLCFPGGGYTDEVLAVAKEAGYRCYMRASCLKEGNNFDHLKRLEQGEFVGLNRMSFSKIRKKLIPGRFLSALVCRISVQAYQKKRFWVWAKKVLRKIG